MNGPGDLALSLLMLAGVALSGGGVWLIVKGRDRKRGALMLVAAVVMFVNAVIWSLPTR